MPTVIDSDVDEICGGIDKNIKLLNKSKLILTRCSQMLKEFDSSENLFLPDEQVIKKIDIIESHLDDAICLVKKVIE